MSWKPLKYKNPGWYGAEKGAPVGRAGSIRVILQLARGKMGGPRRSVSPRERKLDCCAGIRGDTAGKLPIALGPAKMEALPQDYAKQFHVCKYAKRRDPYQFAATLRLVGLQLSEGPRGSNPRA
jgi:hypothetical protein